MTRATTPCSGVKPRSRAVLRIASRGAPAGNSEDYVNPYDPGDTEIDIGDWVQGRPGVSNSKKIRKALDLLEDTIEITVPIWDAFESQGNNANYRVVGFARVLINDYRLPRQNRISAELLETIFSTCD